MVARRWRLHATDGPYQRGVAFRAGSAGRTTPPGDPTLWMLGECACAVNWDAPGGGTAHATGRPLPRAPTGDAAAHRGLEPGPRRGFSIRASAALVKAW